MADKRGAYMNLEKLKSTLAIVAMFIGAFAAQQKAFAQTYPEHPGKIIVPFAAGGPMDIVARFVAQSLEQKLGQPFIVENKGGAGGTLGTRAGMASKPDGYTLVWGSSGSVAAAMELYKSQNFDATSLIPIVLVAKLPHILVVPTDMPAKSVSELVDFFSKNPGKYNYAGSLGAPPHLLGAMFQSLTKLDIQFVPYTGAAPAIVDLLAGRTHMMFDAITVLQPLVESGKLRPLAIVDTHRWPTLKNVPTMPELGYPGMTMVAFSGLFAPAGTDMAIVQKINQAVNESLRTPEAKAVMDSIAANMELGSPSDFQNFVNRESPRWRELVRLSGAKAE